MQYVSRKTWLSPILSRNRSQEEHHEILANVRKMANASTRARHVASWFVFYIVERELSSPSKKNAVERTNSNTWLEFLASHERAIEHLYDQALRFAQHGTVFPSRHGANTDLSEAANTLAASYAKGFKEAYPFENAGQLSVTERSACAVEFKTAVLNAVQERLPNAIRQMVNHSGQFKELRQQTSSPDHNVKRLAQESLTQISIFKRWLFGSSTIAPNDELEVVRNIKAVLGDAVLSSFPFNGGPIQGGMRVFTKEPWRCIPLLLSVLSAFASSPHLTGAKPGVSWPLHRSFVKTMVKFDTHALADLSSTSPTHPVYPPNATSEEKSLARSAWRRSVFEHIFDMGRKPFRSQSWDVGASVKSDGFALNIQMVPSGMTSGWAPSSRGLTRKRRAQLKNMAQDPALSDEDRLATMRDPLSPLLNFNLLPTQVLLDIRHRVVFVDPGARNLLTALHIGSTAANPRVFRYSTKERRHRLGVALRRERQDQALRNLTPELRQALHDFNTASTSAPFQRGAFSSEAIQFWLTIWRQYAPTLRQIWEHSLHSELRMQAYSKRQEEAAALIRRFQDKFGSDAVVVFGSWTGWNVSLPTAQ
ncbi:hypothetical protein OC844_007230 [Tilletia horrida]|nr:hypothetical protein OC844_007230 [Tilletia horrida]